MHDGDDGANDATPPLTYRVSTISYRDTSGVELPFVFYAVGWFLALGCGALPLGGSNGLSFDSD